MATGKTFESTIEIAGVLSPSLQKAISSAVDKLEDMSKETLNSVGAAEKLAVEIDTQESVLKKLRKGYADYVVDGKESSKEAKNLKKEIEKLSRELNDNKDELEEAEKKADRLGKGFDDLGDAAKDSSDGFTVMKGALADLVSSGIQAAVDGLKNLASAAYDAYQEYDEGADIIIQKTGATGEAAADLQSVYKKVSKSVVGDYSDIGTAVGEINTRFGVTGDELETLSTKFLKFAELNGTDVNSAVDNVQKALASFGLGAGDAEGFLDTLNKVGQDTGVSMDTLSGLLLENASSFSQMGLDIHQAAAFLGDIEKSGVTVETAMTGLSKASQYAAKQGKPLTDILEKTTERMQNAKTDAQALQIAYDVFGKKAGAKIYEACKNGTLSFEDLDKAMQNNAGSIDQTYEATQDGMDKIKLAMQSAKAEVGDVVATFLDEHKDDIVKSLEDVTTKLKDAISWLSENVPIVFDWLQKNGPTIAIAIGGIAAAMTAFKVAAFSAKLASEGLTIATYAQQVAQTGLNAVLNANPIGLIILAITALVVAFKYLWDNCEGFRNFWIGLWEKIKEGISIAVDWIKDCWEKIVAFFKGDSPIATYFQMAWSNIKIIWDTVVSYFKMIWSNIKLVFSAVKSVFSGDFSGAWESIKQIFANFGTFFSGLWGNVKQIFSNVGSWFGQIFGGAWLKIKEKFASVGEFFSGIWSKIKSIFSSVGEAIGSAIKGAVSKAVNSVLSTACKIINGFISAINLAIGLINKIPGVEIGKLKELEVPQFATGGFTNGVSIAGEDGMEAVISFDPAYRDKNVGIWEKAGQLLGVLKNEEQEEGAGLTNKAGKLLTLDDFSLGSLVDGTSVVIYYDFSGFTWNPQFNANGGSHDDEADLMARLRAHEAEFFDWLEEFIKAREVAQYA